MKYLIESREEFYPDNSFMLRKDFISKDKIHKIYHECNEDCLFYRRMKYIGSGVYIVTGMVLDFNIKK